MVSLAIDLKTKAKIVTTKLHPMASFGAENASPSEEALAKYTTQILVCVAGKGKKATLI